MRIIISLSLAAIVLSGCQSQANFKSANVIKPHLDAAIIDEAPVEETVEVALQPFVYFDFNSDVLSEEGKQVLDTHINAMKAVDSGQIVLQGHTDQVGGEEFNHNLAKRRANAVYVYLANAGISQERLTATSMGKGDPNRKGINPSTDRHVKLIY